MEEITAILSGDDDSEADPDYEDDNEISSSDSDDIESNPKRVKKNPGPDIHPDVCDEPVVVRPEFFEPVLNEIQLCGEPAVDQQVSDQIQLPTEPASGSTNESGEPGPSSHKKKKVTNAKQKKVKTVKQKKVKSSGKKTKDGEFRVYMMPPAEHANAVTDEDSDHSDCESRNTVHMPRRLLQAPAEVGGQQDQTVDTEQCGWKKQNSNLIGSKVSNFSPKEISAEDAAKIESASTAFDFYKLFQTEKHVERILEQTKLCSSKRFRKTFIKHYK